MGEPSMSPVRLPLVAAAEPGGSADPPGRSPRGRRTRAHPTKTRSRALRRENESADVLSQHGYDVEQNPPTTPAGKNPDYRIEGEYFDCYAPDTDRLDNMRTRLREKVADGQAQRLVLNMNDTPRSIDDVADLLRRKPIADLKELLVIKDGNVVRVVPFKD